MSAMTLTLDEISTVESAALRRVLTEQLELQEESSDRITAYDAYTKHAVYSKHGNCLCVLGGV
jgi:hypothetical protein